MHHFLAHPVKFIAVLGLGSLVSTPLLQAQVQPQAPSGGPSMHHAQPRKEISDKDLQAFAKAYVEVQNIEESHQAALQNTRDPAQVQQLEQQTDAAMAKAMEKQGFTPQTYAQMLTVINRDTTLNKKVLDLVQKERAS